MACPYLSTRATPDLGIRTIEPVAVPAMPSGYSSRHAEQHAFGSQRKELCRANSTHDWAA
jgi:hypothetical protein